MLRKYINWPRLLAGTAAVLAILLPLYLTVLRSSGSAGLEPGSLVDTPVIAGSNLQVGLSEGELAPDFELSSPDGRRFRLSDLRGRAVIINFWARWCGSCLSEMPVIKAVQEERGVDSFSVLAVNAGESRKEAIEFIDFLGAPFVYGLDYDLTVADAYGVYGLPMSVFVDSTGVVQAVYRGHAGRELLERFVDAAISAQPAGPVTPTLRIITTIPRERVLGVERNGDGLVLTSRAFRCDPGYCGSGLVEALRAFDGVRSVEMPAGSGDQVALVLDTGTADALLPEVTRLIESTPDPLYQGPVRVVFSDS